MMTEATPHLDLEFERFVPVPRQLMWRAWTEPEHLMKWFCPRPWQTTECEIDAAVQAMEEILA